MSKGARNRRIKYWVGGDVSLARRLRRVVGWNGIIPNYAPGRHCKTKRGEPLEFIPVNHPGPVAQLFPNDDCETCLGTGNWTGWSGDDEQTQEGGCPDCEGTDKKQLEIS